MTEERADPILAVIALLVVVALFRRPVAAVVRPMSQAPDNDPYYD